jgi:hypothetical protein
MSQKGQWNMLDSAGRGGMPSTTCVVCRKVDGEGWPRRWCHSSSCHRALDSLDVQVTIRVGRWLLVGMDGVKSELEMVDS